MSEFVGSYRNFPIRSKITLTTMLACATALLLASVGFLGHDFLAHRDATLSQLAGVGGIIARTSTAALSFDDPTAAAETLEKLRAEPRIVSACLYGERGGLFASYFLNEGSARCPVTDRREHQDPNSEPEGMLSIPIRLGDAPIGSLLIRTRAPELLPHLEGYAGIIVVVMLASGLLSYLLATRLQHYISAPILRLVETSRRVSFSKDYSLRARAEGDDEIGLLISAYNEMLEQIQQRDRALEQQRADLDEAIQARTAELVDAVEDLRGEITQRKRAEERIRYLAYYDNLTGLPNRQFLKERLERALLESARADRMLALLFVDLDRFKEINDSFGHSTGDLLLRSVAERIMRCVRQSDAVTLRHLEEEDAEAEQSTVSRQGGDEFTILLTAITSSFDAAGVASRILEALREPFTLGGRDVVVGASIGIAVYPHDGNDGDTLLKHADTAMYHAKQKGRNDYEYFSESMKEAAIHKLTIESDLRKAIDRGEFVLHYQPKVDCRTDEVCGLEALVRWQHPEMGLLGPGEFIPVAEETGLIVQIGEWVMRAACIQNRAWHRAGVHDVPVAINVSSRQFRKSALTEIITETLAETGMAPRYLEIEVTETTMLQNEEEAIESLSRLKDLGIKIALDDFGTGYSSLSYVRRLPLDSIKIDRSFVKELGRDSESASIVGAIIAMAHTLGLHVVAEGVETEEQAHFLRSQDCDVLQGFLYGAPLPVDAIPSLFKANESV